MRFLNQLKKILRYDEISSLIIYLAISVIFLYVSLIHPLFFIVYIGYEVFLFKKKKILFYYSLVLSLIYFIAYFLNVILYNSYNLNNTVEGIITYKDDKYLLIKDKGYLIKVYLKKENDLRIGDKISFKYKEIIINSRQIEGVFSYDRYKIRKGIVKEVELTSYTYLKHTFSIYSLKGSIISYIDNNFETLGKLYLKELILGINNFDESVSDGIKELGIIYLFAISGLHISIIKEIIKKALSIFNIPIEIEEIVVIVILVLYSFITNGSVSIKRAVIMNVIFSIFSLLKLDQNRLDVLSFSLFINLFLNPFEILSIGLYLSYLSTGLIYLLNKNINSFKLTLIITVFNIPFLLYFNHEVSLFIVLYSILFSLIFSYAFIPLSYLIIFISPLSFIYEWICELSNYLISLSDDLNIMIRFSIKSPLFLILIIGTIFLFLIKKEKKDKALALISIAFLLSLNYFSSSFTLFPKVKFFDVGQGDAALLRHHFKVALIDTGEQDKYDSIINYLKSENIYTIDYVFISHTDSDHYGEYEDIKNNFNIKNFYLYEDGLDLKMGSFQIKSYCDYINNNPNDSSMCLKVDVFQKTYFFSGDIEKLGEKYIVENADITNIDYLKVPHHGSKTSSSQKLLNKLKPKISIISVGLNNKYGHPNKEVVERLNKYSSDIYRTDCMGSINIIHLFGFDLIYTYRSTYFLPFDYLDNFKIE